MRETGIRLKFLLEISNIEGLDNIAFLYLAEILQKDTAFHALGNFAHIFFDAFQGGYWTFPDLFIVAHYANVLIAADRAICHLATGD
jgi:hypothetical protein